MANIKTSVAEILMRYVGEKTLTEMAAKDIIKEAVIEVGSMDEEEHTPWAVFARAENEVTDIQVKLSDFVLKRGIYHFDQIGLFCYNIVNEIDEEHFEIKFNFFYDKLGSKLLTERQRALVQRMRMEGTFTIAQKEGEFKVDFSNFTAKSPYGTKVFTEEDKGSAMITQTLLCLKTIHLFAKFQDEMDYYPVEVKREKLKGISPTGKLVKRLEGIRENSPRIIYLNAIPEERPTTERDGDATKHRSMAIHQRKRSRRTLTHERFKNHPKYGVVKGVKVKAYWVGKREGNYQGHVYKVLIPEEGK